MNTITEAPPIVQSFAKPYPPQGDTAPAPRIYPRDLEKAFFLYSDAENRGVELSTAGYDQLAAPWLAEAARLYTALKTLKARYQAQQKADELETAARRAEAEELYSEFLELQREAELRDGHATAKAVWLAAKANPYGRVTPATPNQFGIRQSPEQEAFSQYAAARRELVQFIRQSYATQAEKAHMVSGTRAELIQRIDRAAEIVANRTAVNLPTADSPATVKGTLKINRETGEDITPVYTVSQVNGRYTCNCADFANRAPETSRAKVCKHILAVKMSQELEEVEE